MDPFWVVFHRSCRLTTGKSTRTPPSNPGVRRIMCILPTVYRTVPTFKVRYSPSPLKRNVICVVGGAIYSNFANILSKYPRAEWSRYLQSAITSYNTTVHSTTGYPPAVTLYSQICSDIEQVPDHYREVVQKYLRTFDSFHSMKLIVHADAKVTFCESFFLSTTRTLLMSS